VLADPTASHRNTWLPVIDELREAGLRLRSFEPLPGDVSVRRYARLRLVSGERFVVCSYPEEITDVAERFLAATEQLASVGVPTPRVERYSLDPPAWILLEDLGEQTLFDRWKAGGLTMAGLDARLAEAREFIRRMERLPLSDVQTLGSPPLDRDLLNEELELSWIRYLEARRLVRDEGVARRLRAFCRAVCERLGEAPPVPCHRDFMARNLMLRASASGAAGEDLVVIDHQDLRPGPPFYDLASLLNDSLVLPAEARERHLDVLEADQAELYHAAVAQRMLKIAGTFAHFAALGNDRHLPLIPPAISRFLAAMAALPEGRGLAPSLRQSWASDRFPYSGVRQMNP